MITPNHREGGFVALITAIILSLILIVVTVTLNRSGFFVRAAILEAEYKEMSSALAEACADVALLRIAVNPGYSVTDDEVDIGGKTCTINAVTSDTIQTSAEINGSVTKLEVIIDATDLSIESWDEVLSF